MKIEPTGIVFTEVCGIQTERCVARKPAPITAVWTLPGRVQVNVCRPCLEEQIRSGEWEVAGARVERRADIAVYSPDKRLQLIVEVKKSPGIKIESRDWAKKIHRNLLAHGGIPSTPYFLIAILPDQLYLWKDNSPSSLDKGPDYEIVAKDILQKYFDLLSTSLETASPHQLETLVSLWLKDLVQSEPSDNRYMKWFYDSGLYEATKKGSVITEASLAA
ncbi:MAG: hypothetical protein ACR2HX_02590 [Pyrinomonadaceae bacterium]